MKVIAFTGAGISKAAGIPTYQERPELQGKLSVEMKKENPEEFERLMNNLIKTVKDKEPTIAHKILAEKNVPIITMNVDNLHRKAGSKEVYEIHGNYIAGNIVLYGEDIHFGEKAITLIMKTAREAKKLNEEAYLLVIGTSMQTAFAYILTNIAKAQGMKIVYINNNADEEVENFFKAHECAIC